MSEGKKSNREKFKKSIYLLPNAFTSLNLFCGFIAIVNAIDGKFVLAAVYILVASIFDSLDGKVARATNSTSSFGVEYDSLCDLVSFGLAPSLLAYLWVLKPMGRLGWLAAFLFAACGALRLARFNTAASPEISPDSKFTGLPIPAAAGMIATTILFCSRFGINPSGAPVLFLLEVYFLSFLMVSTVKYESFKKANFFTNRFNALVGFLLVFVFIAQNPQLVLFLILLIYVCSGPIIKIFNTIAKKNRKLKHNL